MAKQCDACRNPIRARIEKVAASAFDEEAVAADPSADDDAEIAAL